MALPFSKKNSTPDTHAAPALNDADYKLKERHAAIRKDTEDAVVRAIDWIKSRVKKGITDKGQLSKNSRVEHWRKNSVDHAMFYINIGVRQNEHDSERARARREDMEFFESEITRLQKQYSGNYIIESIRENNVPAQILVKKK
jgi:hypothetical protein